jgi:hypothetical protein
MKHEPQVPFKKKFVFLPSLWKKIGICRWEYYRVGNERIELIPLQILNIS